MVSFSAENVQSLMNHTCRSRNWFSTMERNQELEADVCGSLLLKKLGERTGRTYSALAGYTGYLESGLGVSTSPEPEGSCTVRATHPDPAERRQNLHTYEQALAGSSQ